jgi:hypothetical protein
MLSKKPARWTGSDEALRAVQVAFDVEAAVMDAVRAAAFLNDVSTSDQIRLLLGLPTVHKAKRPRLTVTLSTQDYEVLGARYRIPAEDRLGIKERVTDELIRFATSQADKAAAPRAKAVRAAPAAAVATRRPAKHGSRP